MQCENSKTHIYNKQLIRKHIDGHLIRKTGSQVCLVYKHSSRVTETVALCNKRRCNNDGLYEKQVKPKRKHFRGLYGGGVWYVICTLVCICVRVCVQERGMILIKLSTGSFCHITTAIRC